MRERENAPVVVGRAAGDPETVADLIVVGLTGAGPLGLPENAPTAALARLIASGEARPKLGHVAHTHDGDGTRWLLVGLGEDGPQSAEQGRAAAGAAVRRAIELRATTVRVMLDVPEAAGIVAEAAVLAAYAPEKVTRSTASDEPKPATRIEIVGPGGSDLPAAELAAIDRAVIVARATNEARRLQQLPANLLTPRALATEAQALGAEIDGLEVHVEAGLGALRQREMGLFAAVAHGSDEPPALIVAEYAPADATGPVLGLVGKAVTHDTGGYSLKTPAGMTKMKFDWAGGPADFQACARLARLRLPVRVIAVIAATENLVNGAAMKPGDVFVAANGTTVEVTNTDAEGRLVLADALTHALALGAERLIDIATLTGGVVTALGTSHGGLMGRDEAWLGTVAAAGERSGERVWGLPLEDEHRDLLKSQAADLTNSGGRLAHAIQGAAFLERFSGDVPWAHVDMAALSSDLPRKYLAKGPSGWGVRLLVEAAQGLVDEAA